MKIYCKKCGHPTDYTVNKPKFCSGCGQALSKASVAPKLAPVQEEESEEGEEEIEQLPQISQLDIEIEGDFQIKGFEFGSVLGSNPSEQRYVNDTDGLPDQSKEEILKQFKKEAGSIRSNKPTARDEE